MLLKAKNKGLLSEKGNSIENTGFLLLAWDRYVFTESNCKLACKWHTYICCSSTNLDLPITNTYKAQNPNTLKLQVSSH